nr:hypothetical protein B0A51_08147 [Rachicladosporium sp. CCFEE 5018]
MATSVLSAASSFLSFPYKPTVEPYKVRDIPKGATQYDSKATVRALPSSWYTSAEIYAIERRAIFSKRWLFMTHRSRFKEAGDFLRYEFAGFDVNIVLDRSGKINAFHNVCRHRAYPVIEAKEGNKKILSCRYHGWSYGLDGKLAKAPLFQDFPDFDKSANGLLPVHVHIDCNNFIYINLDASPTPILWSKDFDSVDRQARFADITFADYELDHTYEMQGHYNWKLLADNFNECYHCKTTHVDIPTFFTIDSHDLDAKDGHMQHDSGTTEEQRRKGLSLSTTYFFPNASMNVTPHFMMLQKFLPSSATESRMSYEIYRNKKSSEHDFKLISEMYARVMAEDKDLCAGQQKNLDAGVYEAGELHPRWEKGPLYVQSQVREAVTEHFELERKAGKQIWPAKHTSVAEIGGEEDICAALENCAEDRKELVW